VLFPYVCYSLKYEFFSICSKCVALLLHCKACVYFVLYRSQDDTDFSKAVAASLATYFKQIGLVDASMLDGCIAFCVKDKKAFWLKSARKVSSICCVMFHAFGRLLPVYIIF